jgi:hypothetical protein
VTAADFNGKQATPQENVQWVADNMEISDPSVKECPSAAAWNFLAQCRNSITAKSEFWRMTYPKLLPTKSQLEKEGRVEKLDVGKAAEVIDKLLKFGQEAKDAAGAALSDMTGISKAKEKLKLKLKEPEDDGPGDLEG